MRDHPHVIDNRNMGPIGARELDPIAGAPTKRAFSAFLNAYEKGKVICTTCDIIAMSPPLIILKGQIDELIGTLGDALKTLDQGCCTSCITLQGRLVTMMMMIRIDRLKPVNVGQLRELTWRKAGKGIGCARGKG